MKSFIIIIYLISQPLFAKEGPLPSWNEGENKQAIIKFVEQITNHRNSEYVEPEDRIATFDNDGTLWSEVPTVEVEFTKMKLKELLKKNPKLAQKEPYKSLLTHRKSPTQLNQKEIMEIFAETHAGMDENEFAQNVKKFFQDTKHPKLDIPYTQTAYKPMLELLLYLKKNKFEIFICSGGDTSFMRVIATEVYGIPTQNIIGTNLVDKTVEKNGKLVVVRTEKLELLNDKDGKPVGINRQIGKRPIFAAGNVRSGGDIDHLRYSQEGDRHSMQIMINHDDFKREAAYGEKDNQSLNMSKKYGWKIISIKNDWKEIFSKQLTP